MSNFKRRIEILEAAVKKQIALQRQHDPFVLYRPWNFALNEFHVYYYPEGIFQKPQEYGLMCYTDACALLLSFPENILCQISMGECAEWLFAFHYFSEHSKLYTQEQLERFREKELRDNPELAYLVTEDGHEMMRIMLQLPQFFSVRMAVLQKAISAT